MGITTGGGVVRGLAPKLNLIAVVAPTANDDITKGYTEGSVWVDNVTNMAYTCVEDAPGAAIWTGQGGTVGAFTVAGAGLTSTGSTVDAVGTAGQIVVAADSIGLATTAVVPSTYNSVTVDSFGRVTAGTNVAESFGFSSVAVPTQATIVADGVTDTLNVVAGANIGITTDAATDTITLAVVGTVPNATSSTFATTATNATNATNSTTLGGLAPGNASGNIPTSNGVLNVNLNADLLDGLNSTAFAQNVFSNIVVATQPTIVADTTTDTLTIVAGTGITITTDATTDTLTINAAAGGAGAFTTLSSTSTTTLRGIGVSKGGNDDATNTAIGPGTPLGSLTGALAISNTALGNNAGSSLTTGSLSTFIGAGANTTNATANRQTAVGANASTGSVSTTAIGNGATASGVSSTALGQGAVATGTSSLALGASANVSGNNSVALGSGATMATANTVLLGASGTLVWQPSDDDIVSIGIPSRTMQQIYMSFTNTAVVGAVTINKSSGRVNIAAAGTAVVVTNSLVTAGAHVFAVASTADATARVTSVVPAAGSFTINTVSCTAQTSFDFFVLPV